MEIDIWLREPWDHYYYTVFEDMVKIMPDDCEMYYIIYCPFRYSFDRLKRMSYGKKLVGLMIIEELQFEYNYFPGQLSPAAAHLVELCKLNPTTQFIIFTEIEYFNKEVPKIDNLRIVPIGTGLMFEQTNWNSIIPVTEKNFSSTRTFVSLNRSLRYSRATALSYLLGTGLSKFGHLTYRIDLLKNRGSWLEFCPWLVVDNQVRDTLLDGFEKLKQGDDIIDSVHLADKLYRRQPGADATNPCNNVSNFNQYLRDIYKNTFVELVSESTFSLPSIMVTEKTRNSIFGYNFPIFIAGVGIVKHLREDLKLDMFDDIIDHSYDAIDDNIARIVTAIESNRRLLEDSKYAKDCWRVNQHRFAKNLEVFLVYAEQFYRERAKYSLNIALKEFGYV